MTGDTPPFDPRRVRPDLDAVIAWSHRWIPLPVDDEDDSTSHPEGSGRTPLGGPVRLPAEGGDGDSHPGYGPGSEHDEVACGSQRMAGGVAEGDADGVGERLGREGSWRWWPASAVR
jgi:hypothetical protein